MEKSDLYENGVRLSTRPTNDKQSQTHLIAPCDKLFLNKDSSGNRLLQRWTGDLTFPGCQAVEEELLSEGKINNNSMDVLSRKDLMARRPEDESLFKNAIVDPANLNISEGLWDEKEYGYQADNDYPFINIDHEPFFKSKFYKKISSKLKRPLERYYLNNPEQLTMREIAKKMRIPLSTFHARITQGKEAVKQAVQEYTLDLQMKDNKLSEENCVGK